MNPAVAFNPVRRRDGDGDGAASPAGLVDEPLQTGFDLVVGQEGHVTGMGHRQTVPVPQQGRPRLETETGDKRSVFLTITNPSFLGISSLSWWPDLEQSGEDVKLEHRDVVVAGQVDGGLQGHGLQTQTDGVELMESLAEGSPRHDGPAGGSDVVEFLNQSRSSSRRFLKS